MMGKNKKRLHRVSILVTERTAANLERLTQMEGLASIGRTVDKLVREKMISLRQPDTVWKNHYQNRFGRCE